MEKGGWFRLMICHSLWQSVHPDRIRHKIGKRFFSRWQSSLLILFLLSCIQVQATPLSLSEELDRVTKQYQLGQTHILLLHGNAPLFHYRTDSAQFPNTQPLFRVASLSKSVVGIALLKLAQDGKLDLNTPVRDIAPSIEIDNPWAETDPVRIIHLLEHTAGFDDMHFNEFYIHDEDSFPPLAEVIQRNPRSRTVRWRPGSLYAYSNPGYLLAGRIIEIVTQESFDAWMEREVLKPLGMQQATFERKPTSLSKEAIAKDKEGSPLPFQHIYMRPAAAMQCTAEDLAALLRFYREEGKVNGAPFLAKKWFDKLVLPESSLASSAGCEIGYAKGVENEYFNGLYNLGHKGNIRGFSASFRYFPDDSIGMAILSASELNGTALNRIEGLLLAQAMGASPNILPNAWNYNWGHPKDVLNTPDSSDFTGATGYYQFASPRYHLLYFVDRLTTGASVFQDSTGLYLERGPEVIELEQVGVAGQYFAKDDPQTMAFFGQDEELGDWVFFRGKYFIKHSSFGLSVIQVLLLACLALMSLGVLVFLFSIWSQIANGVRFFSARVLNAIPAVCLGGMIYAGTRLELEHMGTGNVWEWLIFLLGLLMLATTLGGGLATGWAWRKKEGKWIRFLLSASAFANLVITGYLACVGMIGLRLWVY